MSITIPALISVLMEYLFLSPHFQSVCVPRSEVGLCRQHMYGSYFYIHSASLCLLVGAFNPFTFKVIIEVVSLYEFSLFDTP